MASGKELVLEQSNKAIASLLKFESSKKESTKSTNLLDDQTDEDGQSMASVWMVLGFEKISETKNLKPIKMTLKHPWRKADDDSLNVCLITKDPHKEYKEKIATLGLKSITKIVGVSKLRTKFKAFEVRRQLCNSHDLFLADERVLPMLPKLLGKVFFEKKKIPAPVDISKTNPEVLKNELASAIESTYLHLVSGPCTSVKIGLANQTAEELQANFAQVLDQVIQKIPSGWKNIRTIHLKTATSVSLPIYAPAE